jgi:hypothetical protein
MSSITSICFVKFMPFQFSCFIQLNVTKNALMDGRHVSKIYKHVTSHYT